MDALPSRFALAEHDEWRVAANQLSSPAKAGEVSSLKGETEGAVALPHLDFHQLGRRTIGRNPNRWTRRRRVHFEIADLVIGRRHIFGRFAGVRVDSVDPAAA